MVPSTSISAPVGGVLSPHSSRYTTPWLVSSVHPCSTPSDRVPLTRTVDCFPALVGGQVNSPGGPVGVAGMGLVLFIVGGVFVGGVTELGGEAEAAAVEVGPAPLPFCCTDTQALRKTSVRAPATAEATARLIPRLTQVTTARFPDWDSRIRGWLGLGAPSAWAAAPGRYLWRSRSASSSRSTTPVTTSNGSSRHLTTSRCRS